MAAEDSDRTAYGVWFNEEICSPWPAVTASVVRAVSIACLVGELGKVGRINLPSLIAF